jgi:HlyD family secretion protein
MALKRKSGWGKWVTLLVLAGAVAAGVAWYNKRPKEDAPDYKTAAVTRGDITQIVTANGQLSPVKNVQVGSQISGIINDIKVDFNSRVKEGEVIAQMDPSTYERAVEQADAEVANAKAALQLAEVEAKRAEQLSAGQLIPKSDADRAQAELNQAKAVVRMREAALSRAKVDLERTTIYAPISGIVISRNVEPGQTVAASFNTPTLFLIANDLAKMQIEAMVSEADVGGVEEGQKVRFTVDAFLGRQFQGTVKQVRFNPSTNQNVVMYVTVVEVDNADLKLRPGMTANASVVIGEKQNVLKIPNSALRFRPPAEAVVTGATNVPAVVPGDTNRVLRLAEGGGGGDGGPPRSGASREEMRRRFESMSPEEREAFRARMGGRGGGGGSARRQNSDAPAIHTVYVLASTNAADNSKGPVLKAVTVKTGLADASFTEVIEGLSEGETIVSGLNVPATQNIAMGGPGGGPGRPSSPFGGPFGGGGRPR